MKITSRKLRTTGLPGVDQYASSSGEMGLGEGGVIRLLNMERHPGARRVAELLEAFRRAAQLMESIKASSSGEQLIAVNALAEINKPLSKFRWLPRVFGFTQPEVHFKVRCLMVAGKSNDASEQYATQWIVDHLDLVHRVRQCRLPLCRKWFFAKTEHQRFCRGNCRQREASQGEEFKVKRRVYMKKYRKEEAARDKRAKQLAGRK